MPALDSISGFLDSSATLGMTWERGCVSGRFSLAAVGSSCNDVQDERVRGGIPIPLILNLLKDGRNGEGGAAAPPCRNPPYRKSGKIRLSMLLS